MPYTDDQVNILVILNVLASTFSFLGALFIISNFFIFESFKSNFAFKLILFVAIGDIINSVGNFMGSPTPKSGLCLMQAFLTQFGDIVSFAWVTAIAFVIYHVIRREVPPTREDVMRWYKKIHLIIWPTTIFLSILPFFSSNYGYDNGLCWITHSPEPYGEIWRWFCFYIPLWGSITLVSIMYYRIWGQLTAPEIQRKTSDVAPPTIPENKVAQTDTNTNITGDIDNNDKQPEVRASASDVFNPEIGHHRKNSSNLDAIGYQASATDITNANQQTSIEDNKTPKSGGGTLQRIKFYPFVLFGCYLFATIRRIAEWASDDNVAPFAVAACQVFTSALLGTCNAILYGFTPVVRKKDSEWIRDKCCGGNGSAFEKANSIVDVNSQIVNSGNDNDGNDGNEKDNEPDDTGNEDIR